MASGKTAFFSLFDWVQHSTLRAAFQAFANANLANSANRRVRFQIWPCCNLVVIWVCYCYSCYFCYSKVRVSNAILALISPFRFSDLAVILPFLFCRIWVTHSNLMGLCTEPRSGVSEQDCSILSTAFSVLLNFQECS